MSDNESVYLSQHFQHNRAEGSITLSNTNSTRVLRSALRVATRVDALSNNSCAVIATSLLCHVRKEWFWCPKVQYIRAV